MNFWKKLNHPIVGLAPMDGVTDAAFRYMVCKYSKPSFVMTEFTNVEGLARGATKMMKAFIYDKTQRPIVGQLFGVEVESFYKAAVLLCSLGFDGIDINMGCPVNKIARKGSGGSLIKTPDLAVKIIEAVKRGVKDWGNGIGLAQAGVHSDVIAYCKKTKVARRSIPVSVKTRIGYDKNIAIEWTKRLLETKPAAIIMHGRTLKQMYTGSADWEVLANAAEVCKGTGVKFLGNGDVQSMKDAKEKIKKYGVDGVLVGRAMLGNPWFFGGKEPEVGEKGINKRLKIALEHVAYFEKLNYAPFNNVKKHLAWYCKGFKGASELRMRLMLAKDGQDVGNIVNKFKKAF